MEAIYNWLNSLMNKNRSEFAQWSDINWLNPYRASEYEAQRDLLLKQIDHSVLFNGTKPYYNQLSKGCQICGAGKWSCLFITNKCNARCFYCPTAQNNDEKPSTQGLNFDDAIEYAEYIKHFDFKGVSFSGGEPLLFMDRTLKYLKAVRTTCDKSVYTWMYTNGILAEKTKLELLANYGLNEIRFDIGATGFSLDHVKKAKGIIPNITIEIPAIPEEKERLIALLPDMIKAGVTNLNLHQLRLTPHNADQLIKRNYTIINAERPLVLESELTALEIVNSARELDLNIGINYCSFHFKNRFQKAGFRNITAKSLFPEAHITQAGYIREYDGNRICYKSVSITDEENEFCKHNSFNIEGKKYYFMINTILEENNS